MSRREFLEVLRGQLSGQMTQGRAAAHVRYYEDYIQSQVRNGRSESDVLAELGDPRLIAKTLIDTDDSAAVYDESGYSEESYGADDYADNGTESSAGKARSFKLDLSTWYGKGNRDRYCSVNCDTFNNCFGGSCSIFDNFWYSFVFNILVQEEKSISVPQ